MIATKVACKIPKGWIFHEKPSSSVSNGRDSVQGISCAFDGPDTRLKVRASGTVDGWRGAVMVDDRCSGTSIRAAFHDVGTYYAVAKRRAW